MVGLDLTHQALATPDVVERIAKIDTKPAEFVVELLEFLEKCINKPKALIILQFMILVL